MAKKAQKNKDNKEKEDKMAKQKLFFVIFVSVFVLLFSYSYANHSYRHADLDNQKDKKVDASFLDGKNYHVKKIINKKDNIFYTQGLLFDNDNNDIIESGGMYGMSTLTRISYPSMEKTQESKLDDKYFAEGIAKVDDVIYQLTWRERDILKYDAKTLKLLGKLRLDDKMKEGWGLAQYQKDELVATDSTDKLFFLDNKTMKVKRVVPVVMKDGRPVQRVNDITFDGEYVYANVYFASVVVKIEPETGVVEDVYDLQSLINHELDKKTLTSSRLNQGEVLNGIEWDNKRKHFLITGKRWGHLYEVELK